MRAGYPPFAPGVVEDPAGVVEHLTHIDPAVGEFGAGRLDVADDELQTLARARLGRGDPIADDDRALRARRRELHLPEVRVGDVVDVLPKPQRLVEVFGPIDV